MVVDVGMIARFGLSGREGADRREQAAVVVPVDPLQDGGLDRLEGASRSASVDDLCLEQAVDRLRHDEPAAETLRRPAAEREAEVMHDVLEPGSAPGIGVSEIRT